MVDGFQIEVPITIKGGREGERVGSQIGEKIASQIKKSIRAVGIGGGTAGGGSAGMGEAAGMAGMSKGLKGVIGKLGVIGMAIGAAVGVLAQSSPYLKGILSIFGRAFMIFFRPFGDFLAVLLRPLAILMMKMAVAFLKWTRPLQGKVGEAMKDVPQFGTTGNMLVDIPAQIANWALQVGAAIGAVALEIGKGAFELGTKIGQWLLDYVIYPAGNFLSEKILSVWNWVNDFPGWLWSQITTIWSWGSDYAAWIWGKITSIWKWTADFAGWIWSQITTIWSWAYDFGRWLWDQITSAFRNIGSWLSGVGMYLYERITESIKKAFSGFKFAWSWFWQKGQVGIPNVPHEGLYYLHKGEEVVPRTKVGQNSSTVFRPSFNISGNFSSELDVDAVVRRAGRMMEMDLKQRGII